MSTLGLTNTHTLINNHSHNDNPTSASSSSSSSILQRIRALGEAGIKEATFVKKRIPPYAAVGGNIVVLSPTSPADTEIAQFHQSASPSGNQTYYGGGVSSGTTTKIYQNPASPNRNNKQQQQQQQHSPQYQIITKREQIVETPNDAHNTTNTILNENNYNQNAPTSYSRYFDQEILKKQPASPNSYNYNSNSSASSSKTNSLERPMAVGTTKSPAPPYSAFANEIAHGYKNLKKTSINNNSPNEIATHTNKIDNKHESISQPDINDYSVNNLVMQQSQENNNHNQSDYDDDQQQQLQQQQHDSIPISIPIKPFVHRDSIDIGKSSAAVSVNSSSIIHHHQHTDHEVATLGAMLVRPDSAASSINSLNSSLNLPASHNHRYSGTFENTDYLSYYNNGEMQVPQQQPTAQLKRGPSSSYSNLMPMMSSHENLKKIVTESGAIAATNDSVTVNYPFNRTLLNANSLMELSNKSSTLDRRPYLNNQQQQQQHYDDQQHNTQHHMPLHNRSDLFNNTTSNMSSPPSVEFIKNPMRSSFENLSESTNNTNSQSQLVSNLISYKCPLRL
jgi:hypothetical protein